MELKMGWKWIMPQPKAFQQNNKEWLQKEKTELLDGPSPSSDLSPIELLWKHLQWAAHARRPSNISNELAEFWKEECRCKTLTVTEDVWLKSSLLKVHRLLHMTDFHFLRDK